MKTVAIRLLGLTALAWSVSIGAPAWAQMHGHGHGSHAMPQGQAGNTGQGTMPAMTDAEVRKIDMEAGKITLRHAEIKHLEMPPMTMVFTVQDKALLNRVKVGDKVRFQVVMKQGQMLLTNITPAP
jgi:Cu/Ag efflux protein CusF